MCDNGRVYGLGSVDDKAPMAAMLHVAASLTARREQMRGKLIVVCAADEEVGGRLGTKWLADQGYIPESDFIVVGEQTHNQVATAHKGVLRAAFHVAGRTSHATDPWRGRNAINGMAHLILDLERYQTSRRLSLASHPLLGPASINVGLIEGGVGSECRGRRLHHSGGSAHGARRGSAAVIAELEAIVAARQAQDPSRTYSVDSFLVCNWFQTDLTNPPRSTSWPSAPMRPDSRPNRSAICRAATPNIWSTSYAAAWSSLVPAPMR